MLAGDHVKSASDLDVPLVGVGLFYGQGYFRQRLDASGWQQEEYAEVDVSRLPLEPAVDPDGKAIAPEIETRGGTLRARVWQAAVGRRTLLLLDSDVEGNTPEDRALTARLYDGGVRVRIRQELLLGIGGLKALHAAGVAPGVLHLNEGHSAFAVLEAMRRRMEREGADFDTAVREVARRTVFTTHTPAPAGHDRFPPDLVDEHLGPLRDALGIPHERLMGLGRVHPDDAGEEFCMTVLDSGSPGARTPCRPCTARSRGTRGPACGATARRRTRRSGTSPTGSTCRAGWRRRCSSCTTGTAPRRPARTPSRRSRPASRTSATGRCGRPTWRSRSAFSTRCAGGSCARRPAAASPPSSWSSCRTRSARTP